MNTRILFTLAVPFGYIAFAVLSLRCDKDPPTRCGFASGTALARYSIKPGFPADVTPGSGACANLLMNGSSLPATNTPLPITGEGVATEEYLPDQAKASITNSTPRSMAIEPLWVINRIQDAELNEGDGGVPDGGPGLSSTFSTYPYTGGSGANPQPALPPADPTNKDRPYAWGFFDSLYPDSNGVCTASLNPSVIDLPDIPMHGVNIYSSPDEGPLGSMEPDQPTTHVEYTWTNVRVLQQGASVGQQMWADLTITRDGCTAQYQVALLAPQTTCAGSDGGPDFSQCSPTAMPNVSMPTTNQLYGSGLPVGVSMACIDMNALPVGFDAGGGGGDGGAGEGGGGGSPLSNYECAPIKTGP